MNRQQQEQHVELCSLEFSAVNSLHAAPRRHLRRILRQLVREGKVEIFVMQPQPGLLIPHVFKGTLPPQLRSPQAVIDLMLSHF
jgi:hypothetical protein